MKYKSICTTNNVEYLHYHMDYGINEIKYESNKLFTEILFLSS